MKRVPIFPCIVGLHAALAAAALLWALQARFGDPLTAALSPAWDSPWEQGKAAFFPLLAAGPVIWYLAEGGSRSGLCAMAMAGGGAATVLALAGAAPAIAAGGAMAAAVAAKATAPAAVASTTSTWVRSCLPCVPTGASRPPRA